MYINFVIRKNLIFCLNKKYPTIVSKLLLLLLFVEIAESENAACLSHYEYCCSLENLTLLSPEI